MAKKQEQAVNVRYTGQAGIRTVDEYEWNEANGYVLAVADAVTVQRLLDNGDFIIEPETAKEGEE